MKSKVTKQEHYNKIVWTNELMDELRRSECLCLNCRFRETSCYNADLLLEICKERWLAIMVTRCPFWEYGGIENG